MLPEALSGATSPPAAQPVLQARGRFMLANRMAATFEGFMRVSSQGLWRVVDRER
jgi:hypothetical protein